MSDVQCVGCTEAHDAKAPEARDVGLVEDLRVLDPWPQITHRRPVLL